MNDQYLTVALPKGRLGDQAIEKFRMIGFGDSIIIDSRKLIFTDDDKKVEIYAHQTK